MLASDCIAGTSRLHRTKGIGVLVRSRNATRSPSWTILSYFRATLKLIKHTSFPSYNRDVEISHHFSDGLHVYRFSNFSASSCSLSGILRSMDPTTVYTPEYLAENRSDQLLDVAIAFMILETLFVGLYFFSKFKNQTFHGLDTYLMLPAFLCVVSNPINAFRKSSPHLRIFQGISN